MMRVVLLIIAVTVVQGYRRFQNHIPNGHGIPNPCSPGSYWPAVGYFHPYQRTVQKNQFGVDFRVAGFQWTQELCRHDSDGDGMSNGAEVGDPNCTWQPGQAVLERATGHPGICEPVDSPRCMNKELKFECHCMDNPNICNMPGAPR